MLAAVAADRNLDQRRWNAGSRPDTAAASLARAGDGILKDVLA